MPWASVTQTPKLTPRNRKGHMKQSAVIYLWFLADAVLALTPQLHHLASGGAPVFGVPCVLVYLFGTSAFIAASVVAAYLEDVGRHAR